MGMALLNTKSLSRLLLAVILLLSAAGCSSEEDDRLSEEVDKLRAEVLTLKQLKYEVQTLQNELTALRNAAAGASKGGSAITAAVYRPDGSHKDDPFLGPADSDLLVMVFSDFQCLPCRKFFTESFPLLRQEFIDSGKVKFIYRDFPVGAHHFAKQAAQWAHCGGEQGAYWEVFSLLWQRDKDVDNGKFDFVSETLTKLKPDKLKKCVTGTKYAGEINRDVEEGKKIGAKGAPGFFIGRRTGPDEYRGVLVRGAQPYQVIKAEINKLAG